MAAKFFSIFPTAATFPFVPIGVDCEKVAPKKERVFQQVFNDLEREKAKTDKAFTEIWTKKESVVKFYGGSLWADGKHTAIIFPLNALYHGNLCKANVFTITLRQGADEYAVSIATEDKDYHIQQIWWVKFVLWCEFGLKTLDFAIKILYNKTRLE